KHKSVADAENLLRSKGFQVEQQTAPNSTAPTDTVVRQDPSPGSSVRFGSTVTIFVSPGGSLLPALVAPTYQLAPPHLRHTRSPSASWATPGSPTSTWST